MSIQHNCVPPLASANNAALSRGRQENNRGKKNGDVTNNRGAGLNERNRSVYNTYDTYHSIYLETGGRRTHTASRQPTALSLSRESLSLSLEIESG